MYTTALGERESRGWQGGGLKGVGVTEIIDKITIKVGGHPPCHPAQYPHALQSLRVASLMSHTA